jgi:hypothetical protein
MFFSSFLAGISTETRGPWRTLSKRLIFFIRIALETEIKNIIPRKRATETDWERREVIFPSSET